MKNLLPSCLLLLVFSGVAISGCSGGETVPKISAYTQEATVSTGALASSWSQTVSVSSTTVVVCVNGECEVYHEEEVRRVEGKL